jgi:membrane protease YdiL (CAAX protease family)
LWPVVALGLGVVLGWLFARSGYPAAAAAHAVLNALSLTRLRLTAAA